MSKRGVRGFVPEAHVAARTAAGLSVREFARLARVAKTAVLGWEAGTHAPQADSLARAAAVLGVGIDELIQIPAGERSLADLRNLAGMTQSQLAEAIGVTVSTISELERANIALSSDRARLLAQVLGVAVADVAAGWERAFARGPGELP